MILHYAHLCAAAGGVDAFLIGTEMPGLTTIRSGASTYPAVTAFKTSRPMCARSSALGTKIGYAADWSEYFGHQPQDGSGDVFFHLDPLWSDANIDFIGIDNYMPLSDWRDGFDHADAPEGWPAIYDRAYLQANIAGRRRGSTGSMPAPPTGPRRSARRSPMARRQTVGVPLQGSARLVVEPAFQPPGRGGERHAHGMGAAVEADLVHRTGLPAIDRGTNQPNVFFDPKSSESFTPYFSRGWRDDAIQRAYLEASYLWWGRARTTRSPRSMAAGWCMCPNAPPGPGMRGPIRSFPELTDVWTDGPNWRLGHWLTGRLGAVSLAALVRHLCLRAGMPEELIDVSGLWGAVEGYVIGALEAPRLDFHAGPAFRLRCHRDRGRDPLRHARPGAGRHAGPDDGGRQPARAR
jgi:hypothetical protein